MRIPSLALGMSLKPLRVLAAVVVVCGCTAQAAAQTPRVEGPFAGLFGGQAGDRRVNHSLEARGSVFGLYQDVLRPTAQEVVDYQLDPRYQESGAFGGVSGALDYAYRRTAKRSGFYVNGHAAAADYSVQPEDIAAVYNASVGLNTQLTQKVTFNASGYAGYAPFYNFGAAMIPGAGPTPGVPLVGGGIDQTLPGSNFGFGAIFDPNVNVGALSGITANLSKRDTLSVLADYRATRLLGPQDTAYTGYTAWNAGATYLHKLTRQLSLRLGYHREASRYSNSDQRFTRNGYEIGVDYGDAFNLQLGRHTTLSIAPSASVVRWNDDTHFRVNGSVVLTHNMGRTWTASARYVRDLSFVIGFTEPILSDTVGGSVGGTLSRRVRWTSSADWSRGGIGFSGGSHYGWYSATSNLSVALSRRVAPYVQYTLYGYDVPPGSTSMPMLSTFLRQTVSAGLTLFAPIFSSGRVSP